MDFKFDMHLSRDSPDMSSVKFFEKGRGQGHVTLNLNVNYYSVKINLVEIRDESSRFWW